jgi:hypothetical protein
MSRMALSFQSLALLSRPYLSTYRQLSNTLFCRPCCYVWKQRRTCRSCIKLPFVMQRTQTSGKIEYSITESLRNKYLLIQYKPPKEYFREGEDLFYTGGYNSWNGVDSPLILPWRQKNTDCYEIYVPLPEGSRSVEFVVTDGVVYDTNNGAFYHIPLQQLVTEQDSHEAENSSKDKEISELDPLKIPEGPTRYTTDEEIALRKARAEATAVGESMGLSNVLMTEARIEFERFDTRLSGWISIQEAKMCIARLGFEISDREFDELVAACKEYSRNEDMENIHIIEFIYMYGTLELRNEGLEIL